MILKHTQTVSLFALIAILTLSYSCKPEQSAENTIHDFSNVLNVINLPDSARDRSAFSFSDLGAWHSYALPTSNAVGGFVGPFLMTQNNGIWLSDQLLKLGISKDGEILDLSNVSNVKLDYLPGRLVQKFYIDGLLVQMQLIFIDSRTALIETELTSNKDCQIELSWKGKHWFGEVKESHDFSISLKDGGHLSTRFDMDVELKKTSENTFLISMGDRPISLESDKPFKIYYTQSAYVDEHDLIQSTDLNINGLEESEGYFIRNEDRWNAYLSKILDLKFPEYKNVAVKSLETLVTNWRSPAQDILHHGLFPSYAYSGFHGVWSWDSWKHAVAIALFDPELAKEQLRVMYDYQDDMGMIADVIYRDKAENNWRDTKPPLSGWAIWKIYEADGDKSFLEEMYPKLTKYHNWWYEYRDNNQNDLSEYGSTDGTRIAAAWESGMDNAVRFDNAVMIKNNDHAWSLDQESVDLNSYLYAEKMYLIKIAEVLNDQETIAKLTDDANKLKEVIQNTFYDTDKGFFYDKSLHSDELRTVEGTEGWTPLWAGIATKDQAEQVIKTMLDTAKFNTYVPLPTFTKDHPKFNPRNGYWRGPVWLDQFYFGVEAMKKYGHSEEAESLIRRLFTNAEGLTSDGPIRENYHPVTGQGLNANHFSWSAAHLLLLLQNEE